MKRYEIINTYEATPTRVVRTSIYKGRPFDEKDGEADMAAFRRARKELDGYLMFLYKRGWQKVGDDLYGKGTLKHRIEIERVTR